MTIPTSAVADPQYTLTPQNGYQHLYLPEPGFPDRGRQRATSLHGTHTRAHRTSRSRSRKPSRERNRLHKTHKIPQQHARPYSSFRPPIRPPTPNQRPAPSGSRVFHRSECSGRKKAVCIGINYTGTSEPLYGCVNDAMNVREFLIKNWGFKWENIIVLTDDRAERLPTRDNILKAIEWLVGGAKANDSLFFHYSGHGGQVRDRDGDEVDGYDEIILPLDYKPKNERIITDDELNELLVRPIPDGCRLTALFDSCHSGSVLDLVYLYHSNGQPKSSDVSVGHRKQKSSAGDVILFSGCEDHKTSAEKIVKDGPPVGAMSHAFIKCLEHNQKQSYQQLLRGIRKILWKKYRQKPQLSSSHRINANLQFIL